MIILNLILKVNSGWEVLAHAFDPIALEVEAGKSLSLRPAWSTE